MQIHKDYSLKLFNTFGIDAYARHFATFSSDEELKELLSTKPFSDFSPMILGGGSNILFIHNLQSVLKNEIKGIEKIKEDKDHVYIKAGAGENWHQFVQYCIKKGWAGVENLSLIPGNAGASPMQNIGAYGVEIKDVFYSLEALQIADKNKVTFTNEDCHFGYRESVFKNKYKNEFVILNVTYRLDKDPHFNISYDALKKELDKMAIETLTIEAVSQAVIRIRSSKLPDPAKIGNAGSFFKNPKVTVEKYNRLKEEFPELKAFPAGSYFKLAAAWLIEQCGWKGYREGDAGVHDRQALVLVNYGKANGKAVYQLSEKIRESVWEKFGVKLEREINII